MHYAKRPSLAAVPFFKAMAKRTLRIAATADLHYAKHSRGKMQDVFAEISGSADVLLLCGDLTEYGLPEEAEELAADIVARCESRVLGSLVIMIVNPVCRKLSPTFWIKPA